MKKAKKEKKKATGPLVICWECMKITHNFSRGLCGTSYMRAKTKGELDKYPAAAEGGKPHLQLYDRARCETECALFIECKPAEGKRVLDGCMQLQDAVAAAGIQEAAKAKEVAPNPAEDVQAQDAPASREGVPSELDPATCGEQCVAWGSCKDKAIGSIPVECPKRAGAVQGEIKDRFSKYIKSVGEVLAEDIIPELGEKIGISIDLSRVEGLEAFLEENALDYLHNTIEDHILFLLKSVMYGVRMPARVFNNSYGRSPLEAAYPDYLYDRELTGGVR